MSLAGRGIASALRGLAVVFAFAGVLEAQGAATPRTKLTALVPVPAPALDLKDMAGKQHRLADYRGKVVLVNFWATWCEPCRDEMPSMQRLQQRMDRTARGALAVLAVNHGESAARVQTFLDRVPLDFPILLDAFGEARHAWKPGVLPASYLIGKDGRVRYRVIGEIDWDGAEALAVIRGLLAEKS